ncbi:MAG: tetratricopeptide repeat protein [Candidatus Kapaibacteriota bacterium]
MKKAKLKKIIILITFLFVPLSNNFSQNIIEEKLKLAATFEKSGEFSRAEGIYTEIYQQNKSRLDAFWGLVRCKKALNKFTEIIPLVDEQMNIRKSLDLYLLAGEVYWLTGNFEKAKQFWKEAINIYPKIDSTYIKISNIQSNLKQYQLAIETLLTGRKNLGNESLFGNDLIKLFLITNNFEKGIDEILKQFEKNNDLNWVQAKISLLIENKDAKTLLENLLKKGKVGYELRYKYLLAWFYYSTNDWEQAFNAYKNYDELTKSNGLELYRFGFTALNDGQYDIAIRAFENIISLGRKSQYFTNAIYGMAKATDLKLLSKTKVEPEVVKNVIKNYEVALKELSNTQSLYFEIQYRLAYLKSVYLNDFESAEKILLEIQKNRFNPFTLKASLLLGDIYLYQNRLKDAEWKFKELINANNSSKPFEYYLAILKLGKLKYFESQFDSAQYYFSLLIEDAPSEIGNEALERSFTIEKFKQYTLGLSLLAQSELLLEMNKIDSALSLLDTAIKKSEGTQFEEYLRIKMIKTYSENGFFELAERYCNDFLKRYTKSIYIDEVLYLLGFSQLQQSKNLEAIATLTELITKFPRSIFNPKARALIMQIRKKES